MPRKKKVQEAAEVSAPPTPQGKSTMDKAQRFLSECVINDKYANFLPQELRRESWREVVDRYIEGHRRKYAHVLDQRVGDDGPTLGVLLEQAREAIFERRVLPSMRGLQFGGKGVEAHNARMFNCYYHPVDDPAVFSEFLYLLLCGCGVGYSVRRAHVSQLPPVRAQVRVRKRDVHVIEDSIEGWADSVKAVFIGAFKTGRIPVFDASKVRPKDSIIKSTGARAPGPEPLLASLNAVIEIILAARGRQLTTLEVHEIVCHLSLCVRAGGVRRSSLIVLFDRDDEAMLYCKAGHEWYTQKPHLTAANNSAMFPRDEVTEEDFESVWSAVASNGTGEPGTIFTNDLNSGWNPCQSAFATMIKRVDGEAKLVTLGDVDAGDYIWSKEGWTKVLKKWSTGVKPVFRYRTTAGEFVGTENHRIVQMGEKIEVKDAEMIDPLAGPVDSGEIVIDWQTVVDGLVLGDGTYRKGVANHLCIGKNDSDYFTHEEIKGFIQGDRPYSDTQWRVTTTLTDPLPYTYERGIPSRFFESASSLASLLLGLYSANGSVVSNRVTLKTTSPRMRDDVQLALSFLGIRSYYTTNQSRSQEFKNGTYAMRESYDVNVNSDVPLFAKKIGFIQEYKCNRLAEVLQYHETKNTYAYKRSSNVVSREDLGEHEVFDITVDNPSHTYWTGGCDVSNCAEASLRPGSFCNLSTVNATAASSFDDVWTACQLASLLGTLQAGYTDFKYVRPHIRKTTEEDALIGVSFTGIVGSIVEDFSPEQLEACATGVVEMNEAVASVVGINSAARTTLIKPEGTSSCALGGINPGIHAGFGKYWVRRVIVPAGSPQHEYIERIAPGLISHKLGQPHAYLSVPIAARKEGATREEGALNFLERVRKFNVHWIHAGHRRGAQPHNVSATCNVKPEEWEAVGRWAWEHRNDYAGISFFPYDNTVYENLPFEEIDEEEYHRLFALVPDEFDFSSIRETVGKAMEQEAACAGGACLL